MKYTIKVTVLILAIAITLVLACSCVSGKTPETTAPLNTEGTVNTEDTANTEGAVNTESTESTESTETTNTDSTVESKETLAATTAETTADEDEENRRDTVLGCPFGDDFTSNDIYGNIITAEDFKNTEVTMINFWGTFCSPCLSEMPTLGKLAAAYKDKGFTLIGIATDVNGNTNLTKSQGQVKSTGADYTHLAISSPNAIAIRDKYKKTKYVPETVFIDGEGNVLYRIVGSKNYATWEAYINQALYDVEYE